VVAVALAAPAVVPAGATTTPAAAPTMPTAAKGPAAPTAQRRAPFMARPVGALTPTMEKGILTVEWGHMSVGPTRALAATAAPATCSREATTARIVAMVAAMSDGVTLVAREVTTMVPKSVGGGVAMTKAGVKVDLS
jgi:hypothetical protein